jgi:diacylglycerol kinase
MNEEEKLALAKVKNLNRLHHAVRGLYVFSKTTRNLPIHLGTAVLVVILGLYFNISNIEWISLIFAITLVLSVEALNSAIEIDIDLTSPNYHPYARDTKDVAAGAVLISVLGAVGIGLIVFVPKIIILL